MFPRRSLLPSRLAFLHDDPDDTGGGGSTSPPAPGAQPPAPTTRTFSQEDVDRIVSERVAREQKKYEGFDELKAKAAKLDELEAADQTETQRLAAERDAAIAAADAAKQSGQTALEQANTTLKRAEVIAKAAAAGAAVPADVYTLLAGDPAHREHMQKVTVGDDGQVTGAEEAVKALLEARPHLVGTTPRPGSGDGGARHPAAPADLDAQIAEASQKGDWQAVNRLNAQKLVAQHQAARA